MKIGTHGCLNIKLEESIYGFHWFYDGNIMFDFYNRHKPDITTTEIIGNLSDGDGNIWKILDVLDELKEDGEIE